LGIEILFILILFSNINISSFISSYYYRKNIYNIGYKNAGASNIYNLYGLKPALIVGLFDFWIKGFIAVFILNYLDVNNLMYSFSLILIVFFHMFSIFEKLRGGRGVLISIGIICALGLWKEVMIVVTILKFFEYILWKNNALSTFLGIIIFIFLIPFIAENVYVIISLELVFILLLFKRVLTNNIDLKSLININLLVSRILYDRDLNNFPDLR
jgi:glycerol-3-phosphate acyltransferase PlsY